MVANLLTSTFGEDHDREEGTYSPSQVTSSHQRRPRKWEHTLSKKKQNEDVSTTPYSGVRLDDDDAEFFGAPTYEPKPAPEGYKETTNQHPRTMLVIFRKHVLASSVNYSVEKNYRSL